MSRSGRRSRLRLASAARPRNPRGCGAAATSTARARRLADQCETIMFMVGCPPVGWRGPPDDPLLSDHVEQEPEQYGHHRQEGPGEIESRKVRLESLYGKSLGVGGWLLHEEDGGYGPGPGKQHLQPEQPSQQDQIGR